MLKILCFICTVLFIEIRAFKLLKIERGLEKFGLHRQLVTNITYRADNLSEI